MPQPPAETEKTANGKNPARSSSSGNGAKAGRSPGPDALQRRQLLAALRALKRGEFDVRLPDGLEGVDGQISEAFNELVDLVGGLGDELSELREAVGHEGRTRRRLRRGDGRGGWTRYVGAVNGMLDDLTSHTDEIARVVQAVSRGDLTQQIDTEGAERPLRGEFLKHAKAVNGMVEQLDR